MTQGLNQSINDEGVCRTALVTPGLLIISQDIVYPQILQNIHLKKLINNIIYSFCTILVKLNYRNIDLDNSSSSKFIGIFTW